MSETCAIWGHLNQNVQLNDVFEINVGPSEAKDDLFRIIKYYS